MGITAPTNARERFIEKLRESLHAGTFVKLTLSESSEPELRNAYGRLVELKQGVHLQWVRRFVRRDVTKNVPLAEADGLVAWELAEAFARGYLFTTTGDFQWEGPGEGRLKAKRPSFAAQPPLEHDRAKTKAVGPAPWLTALGVTAPDGTARPGMADKLRQIERFTEILGHLVEASPLRDAKSVHVADLGAGKGYLTFAAHEFFQKRGAAVQTEGVEQRAELVAAATAAALDGMRFEAGEIATFQPRNPPEVLVALHACNTATDDALHLGVNAGAQLILVAPCCHQELRPQITAPAVLAPVLQHGILLERYAEMLTDGIRALVLAIHGYEARVFEFIAPEHTGKNVMIAARRLEHPREPESLRAQLRDLLAFHAVREQRLARLLGEI